MGRDTVARLSDDIHRAFQAECAYRKVRGRVVLAEDGQKEVEWVIKEREFMLSTVNSERASRGKPPVTMESIRRVETMSCGHFDYSRKFSIYCAELVLFADDARYISSREPVRPRH